MRRFLPPLRSSIHRFALCGLLCAGLAACGTAPSPTAEGERLQDATPRPASAADLAGAWRCVAISATVIEPNDAPTLEFASDGRASGFSGVNRFFGPYQSSSSGTLSFGAIGATRMAGSPERMRLEDSYLAALGMTRTAEVSGGELRLGDGHGTLLAFVRGAAR